MKYLYLGLLLISVVGATDYSVNYLQALTDEMTSPSQMLGSFIGGFQKEIDAFAYSLPQLTLTPQGTVGYKGKHEGHNTPMVRSVMTTYKNTWILYTSIVITLSCYYSAWLPLVQNDAGSFFTDCTTMWNMYVYFFEDKGTITYQYS